MALVVPNAVLVRLIWTKGGTDHAVNVWGFRKTGALTVTQDLANAVGAAVKSAYTGTGYVSLTHSGVALSKVGVRDISSPNLPEFLDNGAAVPGTATGNALPPQVACCVTLRTALAGQSFRGRSFLQGFAVGSNDANGQITSATATACVNFVEGNRTGLVSNGLSMAIVSRKNLSTELVTLVQSRDLNWETIRARSRPGI